MRTNTQAQRLCFATQAKLETPRTAPRHRKTVAVTSFENALSHIVKMAEGLFNEETIFNELGF